MYCGLPRYVYIVNKRFRKIIGTSQCVYQLSPRESRKREREVKMLLGNPYINPDILSFMNMSVDLSQEITEDLFEFISGFQSYFRRTENEQLGLTYLKGLLSDINRKNAEQISLRYNGTKQVRSLQKHLVDAKWDDEGIIKKIHDETACIMSEASGMLTLDESDFAKKGNHSVGVSRQYCGNKGKIDNCQAGVFIGYASNKGYALVDKDIYIPEKWFGPEYAEERTKVRLPEELGFRTKLEIGLDLIKKTLENGKLKSRWVAFDSYFGASFQFRDTISDMGYNYFADVKKNMLVYLEKPEIINDKNRSGISSKHGRIDKTNNKPIKVKQIATNADTQWQWIHLSEGAKGPIIVQMHFTRVFVYEKEFPIQEVWLIIRKNEDGTIKYSISNASADIDIQDLIDVATKRWSIEQIFKLGKTYLGMDHYENRIYRGWHRHMVYVMLAILFLNILRIKYECAKQSL